MFCPLRREENVVVRFIEFMPLEEGRLLDARIVVTLREIVSQISRALPLVELPPREASETARRYTFADGVGEIGIIAPSARHSAEHAAVCASPPTAKFAPAFSRKLSTTSTAACAPAPATMNSAHTSSRPSMRKKPATTSASQDSLSPPGRWCTSADNRRSTSAADRAHIAGGPHNRPSTSAADQFSDRPAIPACSAIGASPFSPVGLHGEESPRE